MGYARKDVEKTKKIAKKFVLYQEGAELYSIGLTKFQELAKELSAEYGKGYTKSNLYSFYSFYKTYPDIFQTPSGKSVGLLSWSHYATLLQVKDPEVRDWYEKEATEQTWSGL